MKFLLTNDDGIYSRGLASLYAAISEVGDCTVVAPEREQSAVGHAITLSRPLMVKRILRNSCFEGYAVAGTPADCVKIGVKELSKEPFDLIISGINRGANVGINVIYSGTVSAATEGTILGIPSMAVSLDSHEEDADYSIAAMFAKRIAMSMVKTPHLKGVTLNVNVPSLPEGSIGGVEVTRQGTARLVERFEKRTDPRNNLYYWLAGETFIPREDEIDTDASALGRGFVSITPIQYDLTRYAMIDSLKARVDEIVSSGSEEPE